MRHKLFKKLPAILTVCSLLFSGSGLFAQTQTVYEIISGSANHTTLKAAIDEAGLDGALNDENATYTVFAPDNDAFADLLAQLGITANDLLDSEDLESILLYHVVSGASVGSGDLTNGQLVEPMNTENTIKVSVISSGIFVNQAEVDGPDLDATNGVVHSINAVILDDETVVDVAIENEFTTLVSAVIAAELLPVLTNPFGTFTVFAPTNDAFENLATALDVSVEDLLDLPNLADVLTYHVLASEVESGDIENGAIVDAVSTTNTLKLTVTSDEEVFVNQAQVTLADVPSDNGVVHVLDAVVLPNETVVDVAIDNEFTTLVAAVVAAELLPVLTDPLGTFTVFAPTNEAFDNLAAALDVDLEDLLELPNLADILTYHVLASEVESGDIENGAIVDAVSTTNTLKLTVTSDEEVFVNQAQVTLADVPSDNGVVHVLDAVVLPNETVVDVAIDNEFTTLVAAVVAAELLPVLTDPLGTFTVFAPTNEAFDNLAAALDVDLEDLLELPNLADILTYHVLASEVESGDIENGAIVDAVSTTNTLKLTVTSDEEVFVNQAQVALADVPSDNGIVHVLDAVVLPNETVVDVAIDNGLTSLTAAVVAAELVPVLSNPFSEFTVFAPTNDAFDALATELDLSLNDILGLPNLADILLYHVVAGTVLSTDLTAGDVPTLFDGETVTIGLDDGVQVNDANVITADVEADNGVAHVIDAVLLPETLSTNEVDFVSVALYPNPSSDFIKLSNVNEGSYEVRNMLGAVVLSGEVSNNPIAISSLETGTYFIRVATDVTNYNGKFIKN